MKALRLPMFIALVAALATFPALATTLSTVLGAEPTRGIPNWTAPPYWTPHAEGTATSAGTGREALAGTSSPPLPFVAIAPCRVVDTRGYGFTGEYGPPSMAGGASRNFTIGGQCGIPASAVAVSFNFTVWNTSSYGDFNIYPTGGVRPTVSSLNWGPGVLALANAAVVPLGTSGQITVVNESGGTVDIFADVNGYYSAVGVVTTLNGLSGDVTLAAGSNVTITPAGQALGISAAVPAGAAVFGKPGDTTLLGQGFTEIGRMDWEAWSLASTSGAPTGTFWHCSVWTGTKMFVWGGQNVTPTGVNSGGLYDPATDTWSLTSVTAPVPSPRRYPSCVWTGSLVLVWGGENTDNYAIFADGARYDPVGNSWTAMQSSGAPAGRFAGAAVWAATASPPRMLIWGGLDRSLGSSNVSYPPTGGAYNPVSDTWSLMSTSSQPTPRASTAFVWTGSKLVVWGGYSGPAAPWTYYNNGGRYDPSTNTWSGMAATALSTRYSASGVWTGTRMIVWGGYNGSYFADGALYDPVGDAWTSMTSTGAPAGRYAQVAVWTGWGMIIWSGYGSSGVTNTGGIYDPAADRWRTMTTANAPVANYGYTGHWTGPPLNEMVVWGGYGSVGGRYRTLSLFIKN